MARIDSFLVVSEVVLTEETKRIAFSIAADQLRLHKVDYCDPPGCDESSPVEGYQTGAE